MTSLWYMTTEKTIALTVWIFVNKVMSPGGSEGKVSAWNAGDPGSIAESGRFPGEGNDNLLQYSCLENLYGQRSLVDCGPRGHKGSSMT